MSADPYYTHMDTALHYLILAEAELTAAWADPPTRAKGQATDVLQGRVREVRNEATEIARQR